MAVASEGGRTSRSTANIANTTPWAQAAKNFTATKIPAVQQQAPATAPVGDTFSGSYSAPGAGVMDAGPVRDEAWVATNDGMYQTQKAALESAREAAISKLLADFNNYDVDYGNSLRKLGFTGNARALDNAKYDNESGRFLGADNNPIEVGWNESDQNTAAGRGLSNLMNDFAARGMLQSSAYGQARNDLFRSLNDQLSASATARNRAFADTNAQVANQKQTAQDAMNQALREAVIRNANGITG